MKKKRILLYNNFFTNGGVEVFLKTLAEYLAKANYDVTVAATPRSTTDHHQPFGSNIRYVWRPFLKKGIKKHSLAWFLDHVRYRFAEALINTYLSLQGYDIVVAVKEKWVMRTALKLRGKRKFAWIHTDFSTWPELQSDCFATPEEELACMRRYEKVVCVSETSRKGVLQMVGDPENLVVKYLPIKVDRILELGALPCPLARPKDRLLIVSVGRLSPEKQYLLLLKACVALRSDIPFDLWIIGEGKDRPNLEAYIAQEKLGNVHLLGAQENPYHYLAQADLFVSSSRTESYGLAVQEALILGVPVVAVRCPGIEESLDTRFGVLTGNSVEALTASIRAMLQDPNELRRYRETIAGQFVREKLYEERLQAITDLWEDQPQPEPEKR